MWTEFTHTHTFIDPIVAGVSVRVDNDGYDGQDRSVYWDALQLSIDTPASPPPPGENTPPTISVNITAT